MTRHESHLGPERIQEFLDRELSSREDARIRGHLDECARCAAEVEAWESVFARLESMEGLAPPPSLTEKVLGAVRGPERRSLLARLLGWIPSLSGGSGHPSPAILQSYLDRALGLRKSAAVESHAADCARCAAELTRWKVLLDGLSTLGRTAPPPGFADRVMAQVRAPRSRSRQGVAGRSEPVPSTIRSYLPRSRRAWAVAAVPIVAPLAAMTLGIVALFSAYPLLTPGSAFSFFWWQMTGAVDSALSSVYQYVLGSPFVLDVVQGVQALVVDPVLLRSVAILLCGVFVASLWILYRNLAAAPPVDRGYANGSA